MTKEQIAALCERVGFPQPRFQNKVATIRVPVTLPHLGKRTIILAPLPKLTPAAFDKWCGDLGHAGAARFVNYWLGTGYTPSDIQKMRDQGKGISTRIRALVRDFAKPFDPKT